MENIVKSELEKIFSNDYILKLKQKFIKSNHYCDLLEFHKCMRVKVSNIDYDFNDHKILTINVFDDNGNIFYTHIVNTQTRQEIVKNSRIIHSEYKQGNYFTDGYMLDCVSTMLKKKDKLKWYETNSNNVSFSCKYTPSGTSVTSQSPVTLYSLQDKSNTVISSLYADQIFLIYGANMVNGGYLVFDYGGKTISQDVLFLDSSYSETKGLYDFINYYSTSCTITYCYEIQGVINYSTNKITVNLQPLTNVLTPVITGFSIDDLNENYTVTTTQSSVLIQMKNNQLCIIPLKLTGINFDYSTTFIAVNSLGVYYYYIINNYSSTDCLANIIFNTENSNNVEIYTMYVMSGGVVSEPFSCSLIFNN